VSGQEKKSNHDERLFLTLTIGLVRKFALDKVAPHVLAMDEAAKMRPEIVQECFSAGLMGIETPTELSGAGMSFFSSIVVIEELARVDPAVSVMVDVQNTLANGTC
jgi:short-chain 2-methylacyl-CoA dehydrogenase